MKVKITKNFDLEDSQLLYCETHNQFFGMVDIANHIECEPTPHATININWSDLFYKCMTVKTGPNMQDIAEGRFSEKWSKNESERARLFEKMAEQMRKEGWVV